MDVGRAGLPPLPAVTAHNLAGTTDRSEPRLEGAVRLPVDVASLLASELSKADLERLIDILEPLSPAITQETAELLNGLELAAQVQDIPHAISLTKELAAVNPKAAEDLPARPGLSPMRTELEQTIRQITTVSRNDAERELAAATARSAESQAKAANWHADANVLLDVCTRLFAAGGLANYRKVVRLAATIVPAPNIVFEVQMPREQDARLHWHVPFRFLSLLLVLAIAGFALYVVTR